MVGADITREDVVSALLGAAATLAGIVLVFVGFTIAALDSFGSQTMSSVKAPYRQRVVLGAVAVGVGLVDVTAAVLWMLGVGWLYVPVVVLFFVQLAATVGVAGWTVAHTVREE